MTHPLDFASACRAWLTLVAATIATVVLACMPVATGAATMQWPGRPFEIVANDKPLADFLRELVSQQGVTAVVDPKISGVISGRFNGQAQKVLDSVAATFGLIWYYDGAFIYIDQASDARSEVLSITAGNGARVAETVARLSIADPRYPLVVNEEQGSVFVSGPKRYVEMVQQAARLADQRAAETDQAEVRMFPLKYAWADDVRINRAGAESTVPGVTRVLRSLFDKRGGASAAAPAQAGVRPRQGPTRQVKLSNGETVTGAENPLTALMASRGAADAGFAASASLPQFHADTRTNAVLIRDLPGRMEQYARLIETMDTRPLLVEIEVTIMDISNDTLDRLGLDWRLHGSRGDVQIGNGNNPPLSWENGATAAGQTGATAPAGGVFTAAIGNELRTFLLARVNALAKKGEANFVARPKVLTLNNTEALLENMSELHVRVDGFQDAGLFSINAGTALRVTPLIIDERSSRGVLMSINIEDGDLSGATVDNIPVVRRRTVNTQALVAEGTSVLIAGFSSEEKTNATTGVPLLSDVPIIGNLFKYTEKTRQNMERFYLVSPRMVSPVDASASAAAAPAASAPASSVPATSAPAAAVGGGS